MVHGLVDRLKPRPWLVLLLDGIGATLSALSLGLVLPALGPAVGMPRPALYVLALIALVYAACSIGSYYLRRNEWQPWVRAMSRLNLAYSGATAALVVLFWTRLTWVGITYFFLECLLIGTLVVMERRVLAAHALSVDDRP